MTSIQANRKLTAYDYINMPIRQLISHPDFDSARWVKVCAALAEANRLIEAATRIRQGIIEA